MFLNSFAKKRRTKWLFWLKTKLNNAKFDWFLRKAPFFCRKSQKIVIITSTPDWAKFRTMGQYLAFLEMNKSSPHFRATFFRS
jgi:hypothetical protein